MMAVPSIIEEKTEEKTESFISGGANGSGGARRRKDTRKKLEAKPLHRGATIAGKSNCDSLSFVDEKEL